MSGVALALTVLAVVLGVTAVLGLLGVLIDRGAAGHELGEDR